MTDALAESPLFTEYTDPRFGVPIYLLTRKIAPLQQTFYFVNDPSGADGRYLWFYAAFPPGPTKSLGVVDLEAQEVRHFPETQFLGSSPYVDAVTGEAYWATRETVWKRGPQPDGEVVAINSVPEVVLRSRPVHRLATHLTRSADGRCFFLDGWVDDRYFCGALPIGGGDFELWQQFWLNHNHAQFSPTDPDLALIAWDHTTSPVTGERLPYYDRLHLIRRGGRAEPLFPEPTRVTHEWWDPDGRHIWAMQNGTVRIELETAAVERVWPGGKWHASHDATRMYLVADNNDEKGFYRGCPSTVDFFNRHTGRELRIVRNPEMSNYTGARYHIDPHPRFCCGDRYIAFTTTIRGEVDLALVEVATLIERTA